jgi:hypothetical protein
VFFLCRSIGFSISLVRPSATWAGCGFQKAGMLVCLVQRVATAPSSLFFLCDPAVRIRLDSGDPVGPCRLLHACRVQQSGPERRANTKRQDVR